MEKKLQKFQLAVARVESDLRAAGWKKRRGFWYAPQKVDWGGKHPKNETGMSIWMAKTAIQHEAKKRERITANNTGKSKIPCNLCGNDCRRFESPSQCASRIPGMKPANPVHKRHYMGPYGLVDAEFSGGWMSDPLSDGYCYRFSLCEYCLAKLFKKFKIPVAVEPYL